MTHKLSSACAEMIQAINSRLNRSVSPINWNLSRHGFVALWLLFYCVYLFASSLFFGFCSLFCSLERDQAFGLCIGPLPVYFCSHYSIGPCVNSIINLICNRLG